MAVSAGGAKPPHILESAARALAHEHELGTVPADGLAIYSALARIPEWLSRVDEYCADPKPEHARAADWLLDNNYQVIRAIRQVGEDLPVSFYRKLPALALPSFHAIPRAFIIAHAAITVMPRPFSAENLERYINAYQEIAPLDIAELWALPSMLRLAHLEVLADAFQRLAPDALTPPWVISACLKSDDTADTTNLVAQAITGLTAVNTIKWTDFFDRTSCVERILRGDPAGVYISMDMQSRDRYRQSVERLAAGSSLGEVAVALRAIEYASGEARGNRGHHVGFWLIDRGADLLELSLGYRPSWRERLQRAVMRHAGPCYTVMSLALFLAALVLPMSYLSIDALGPMAWAFGVFVLFLPASMVGLTLVHWLISMVIKIDVRPAIDYRKGIPPDCRTAVVVPVIISRVEEIPTLFDALELRRLANPDPMLHFVLLSDPPDADREVLPRDQAIENALVDAVTRLNGRVGDATGERLPGSFCLLHRRRHFNSGEGCWMGRERKRGKIEAFNQFVLTGDMGEFSVCEGDLSRLRETKYVITLDADTMLPPGAAASLIGIISHPLNSPEWDPVSGRIVSGYSIIQPRLEVLPLSGPASSFCRLLAGDTVIDIYSRAVSDVYQDLFGSGTFVGKGIYEVESFQRSLQNRVPDNAILSHDLFEGAHARTALASNVILYESFPTNYPEYALRLHRWIRGDWQLLPWLGKKIPTADGSVLPDILSFLDRWKIVDNLRRSLVQPALLLLLLFGWTVLPGSPWIWTILAVLAPGVYLLGGLFSAIARLPRRVGSADFRHRLLESSGRWFLSLVFLVNDTFISLDAIFRTLWRLLVSRRRLLQWRPAAHVQSVLGNQSLRKSTWLIMWPSSLFVGLLTPALAVYRQDALIPAAPLLTLWLIAPEIAIWLSHARESRRQDLDGNEQAFLLRLARRTWHFFETLAGPYDNWLPPDNVQAGARDRIAHRTSPTNIGMLLASAAMARDFGFICTDDFVVRIRNALDSIERLKTHRGHVLNWYNTITLEPLEPRYVSTVDSGNLAMCLVALQQGCLDFAAGPVCSHQLWRGLETTFELLMDALIRLDGIDVSMVERYELRFRQALPQPGSPAWKWRESASELVVEFWPEVEQVIAGALADLASSARVDLNEARVWLDRFHHDLHALNRQLDEYLPWLHLLAEPPPGCEELAIGLARELSPALSTNQLGEHARSCEDLIAAKRGSSAQDDPTMAWLQRMESAIGDGVARQRDLRRDLLEEASRAEKIAFSMDFSLLYDPEARLFRIGYNVSTGQEDHNHYDLLASEARIASFFAIAKRDVPMEHWFSLGRPVTRLKGRPVALSWSGSMFEYLMPALFMPGHRDTLLGESESIAVLHQRDYARTRKVPWGISESAFAVTDAEGNYQYKAFGAPGLGLRRGLSEDLVVAPYASALALGYWPGLAVKNLVELARLSGLGVYGFVDALDFTPRRSPEGSAFRTVATYMAHHQGMIALAVANVLNDDIVVRRVMSDRRMRTFELLLQERIPWEAPVEAGRINEAAQRGGGARPIPPLSSWIPTSQSSVPQVQMLGNGRMSTWQSEAGAGCLSWRNCALTRWLPDSSGDVQGHWLYLRDVDSRVLWSATRLPTGNPGVESKTVFHPHKIEHFCRNYGLAVRVETTVAADDDVDVRRVTLVNEDARVRTIELTSYAEVVLAPPLDDERHPAFSKLFVSSEFDEEHKGLLFARRVRQQDEMVPHLLHMAVISHASLELVDYETDRGRFLGRNGSPRDPLGLRTGLSKTTGWTLDPVMSLTVRATLQPNETVSFSFLSIAAISRSKLWEIAGRYQTASLDWVFRDAARMAAREVERLKLDSAVLSDMQALASLLLQPHPEFRAAPAGLQVSCWGQEELWRFGISGDLPILLLRVARDTPSVLLETLLRVQLLWRRAGLVMDVVILYLGSAGYEDPLREAVQAVLRDADAFGFLGRRGGVHLLYADRMDARSQRGIEAAAHVVLDDDNIPLWLRLDNTLDRRAMPPYLEPTGSEADYPDLPLEESPNLQFANGLGGFEPASGDYIIELDGGEHTPAPWCNVLTNDEFGAVVSESGLGFSWAANSGENRVTQSSGDPVQDSPGEVLYLRDEVTAHLWTVTPAPMGEEISCRVRHGAGFTRWQKQSHGLGQDLLVFVPPEEPVKLAWLRLRNHTDQPRRVTATYYAQWLLGSLASNDKAHIRCEYDPDLHAIVAHNPWHTDFCDRVAFLSSTHPAHSVSGDRYEFLGHEGTLDNPAGLRRSDLGGGFNCGGDPCAVYQVHLDLAPGESAETVFILGQGIDPSQTSKLLSRYRDPRAVASAFADLTDFWAGKLNSVQVKTPDPAFDLMVNRWLIYQTLASRMMARAGFYQASGAYGFRDQLQDSLALLQSDPQRVRRHILTAARHQFEEGDVQHWWHPPAGRGVRTRCSDDYLWLPYVTARYVAASADDDILDSTIPFLMAPRLGPEEHDRYAIFDSGNPASLYEHCCRAMNHMMRTGAHGLPLIGGGDWNDGMDRIGVDGRGESVWLAWFQIATINEFVPLAVRRGDAERAGRWQQYARQLKSSIDEFAWDGEWFIRALDDGGEPWGSRENSECRIDSISQSWAVLAGFGGEARVRTAMSSAREQLLHENDRLVLLLDPPFHRSSRDPGYIQAYPPGIRENGGQYSHAAGWLGLAFAHLGDGDTAWQIFDILNPIRRTGDPDDALLYQREPYVLAADVYSQGDKKGRGGWSWYTGAAGWTWQLGVTGILGLQQVGGGFTLDPCLPRDWGGAELTLTHEQGVIRVVIEDPDHVGCGVSSITVDGETLAENRVAFPGRNQELQAVVRLGRVD